MPVVRPLAHTAPVTCGPPDIRPKGLPVDLIATLSRTPTENPWLLPVALLCTLASAALAALVVGRFVVGIAQPWRTLLVTLASLLLLAGGATGAFINISNQSSAVNTHAARATAAYVSHTQHITALNPVTVTGVTTFEFDTDTPCATFDGIRADGTRVHVTVTWPANAPTTTLPDTPLPTGYNPVTVTITS